MKKLLPLICSIFISINLISQVTVISQTNVSCPGLCNGAITLSITGGTAPYTITNIGSSACTFPPFPSMSNTVTLSGLCACGYTIQVKDGSAAIIGTVSATITAPPPIVTSFSVQNVCCNGQCNGAVYAFVTGGTPGYSYTWFPAGPTGTSYTAACAGSYDLCVTDSKGCSKCSVTNVSQPPVFSVGASTLAASCSTCCNGAINAMGVGGQPGYSYTLFPGGMTNTTGTFSNVCSGSYSICASDAGCCSMCIGVTVPTGSATAVKNINPNENTILIYPNPSKGTLYLKSQIDISNAVYEVHDVLGKKIDSGEANDFAKMTPLKDGIYFVTIRNKDFTVLSRAKVIIEK